MNNFYACTLVKSFYPTFLVGLQNKLGHANFFIHFPDILVFLIMSFHVVYRHHNQSVKEANKYTYQSQLIHIKLIIHPAFVSIAVDHLF